MRAIITPDLRITMNLCPSLPPVQHLNVTRTKSVHVQFPPASVNYRRTKGVCPAHKDRGGVGSDNGLPREEPAELDMKAGMGSEGQTINDVEGPFWADNEGDPKRSFEDVEGERNSSPDNTREVNPDQNDVDDSDMWAQLQQRLTRKEVRLLKKFFGRDWTGEVHQGLEQAMRTEGQLSDGERLTLVGLCEKLVRIQEEQQGEIEKLQGTSEGSAGPWWAPPGPQPQDRAPSGSTSQFEQLLEEAAPPPPPRVWGQSLMRTRRPPPSSTAKLSEELLSSEDPSGGPPNDPDPGASLPGDFQLLQQLYLALCELGEMDEENAPEQMAAGLELLNDQMMALLDKVSAEGTDDMTLMTLRYMQVLMVGRGDAFFDCNYENLVRLGTFMLAVERLREFIGLMEVLDTLGIALGLGMQSSSLSSPLWWLKDDVRDKYTAWLEGNEAATMVWPLVEAPEAPQPVMFCPDPEEVDEQRISLIAELDLDNMRFLKDAESGGFTPDKMFKWAQDPVIGPRMMSGQWLGKEGTSKEGMRLWKQAQRLVEEEMGNMGMSPGGRP